MFFGEDAEVKVLEGQNKVLSAMYDEEKTNPELLTKELKREVCEVAQVNIADVKDVFDKYKQLEGFHSFLIKRRDRGEPMPENNDELMDIYKYEKPAFLRQDDTKQKYSKAQRERMYRRQWA